VLSEAKNGKKRAVKRLQKPESAVKSPKTKIHVAVAKNIKIVTVNKLANLDKIRENASFSFYQKNSPKYDSSHFKTTLIYLIGCKNKMIIMI